MRFLINPSIWSLLIIVFLPLSAQEAGRLTLSLERCEQLALKNNPLMKEAQLGVTHSEARRTQAANAAFLPKLELKNFWGAVPRARAVFTNTGVLTSPDTSTGLSDLRLFTEVDLELLQPLHTFGKLSGLKRAAGFGVEAEEANLQVREGEVRLMTRKLYWGLVLGHELLKVIEDARGEVDKAEKKLNEKLDEGSEDVSQNDLFKLQIFRYEINKRWREAQRKTTMAYSALAAALGLPEGQEFAAADSELEALAVPVDSLPQFTRLALERRPDLQQLRAGMGARRALIGVSRSDYYPQLFLAGGAKYNYAQDRDDPKNPWVYNPTNFFRPALLLGVSMNLNFLQTRDKVRLAESEYLQMAQKEDLLVEKIRLDVQQKYLELNEAQHNIRESRKALKASENWLRSVSMSFDIGVAEVKDLIDAYKANSTMRAEHLQNIFEFNVLVAELSREIGYDLYARISPQN